MIKYETDVARAWSTAYAEPHKDPHGLFATLLGVERDEAKAIAYKYMYSEEGMKCSVIQQYHQAGAETRFVYRYFADMLGKNGLGIAVPELQEIFNEME